MQKAEALGWVYTAPLEPTLQSPSLLSVFSGQGVDLSVPSQLAHIISAALLSGLGGVPLLLSRRQLPTLSWLQGELVWLPSRLLSPLSCWTVASATSSRPPPPFSLISICQQLVEGQTDTFLPVPVSSSGSGLTHLPDSLPSTVSPIP